MGNLKFAILGLGVIGLVVLLVLPLASIDMGELHLSVKAMDIGGQGKLILGGFALAAVMGGMSLKMGLQKWIAGVAAAGFAIDAIKLRDGFSTGAGSGAKIGLIVGALGVVVSILGAIKGDAKA